MGELFFFFYVFKEFFFPLLDPIGMTQQVVYHKESSFQKINYLVFTQSSTHIVSLQNLFSFFPVKDLFGFLIC